MYSTLIHWLFRKVLFNAHICEFLKCSSVIEELHACTLSHLSCVQLFVTLGTVACQAPLSMGFSKQEYQSGLPCPPPWDLPNPGSEPTFLTSAAFADVFFTTSATWEALLKNYFSSMWLDIILCKTSIPLNLFRLVLWPSIWSSLDNLPHVIENLHPVVIWSVQ